jgi:hypothetical protein
MNGGSSLQPFLYQSNALKCMRWSEKVHIWGEGKVIETWQLSHSSLLPTFTPIL